MQNTDVKNNKRKSKSFIKYHAHCRSLRPYNFSNIKQENSCTRIERHFCCLYNFNGIFYSTVNIAFVGL